MKYSEFCEAYDTIRSKAEDWIVKQEGITDLAGVEALDFDTNYVTAIYWDIDERGSKEIPLSELFDFEIQIQ